MTTPVSELDWLTGGGEQPIRDQWAALAYKHTMRQQGRVGSPPKWMPYADWRRLLAYQLLEDYWSNTARWQLGPDVEADDRGSLREYGDPKVLVKTIRSIVLGDEQTISIDGADTNTDLAETQDWLRAWAEDVDLDAVVLLGEERTIKLGTGVVSLVWSESKGRVLPRVWHPGHYFPDLTQVDENGYPTRVDFLWEEDPLPGQGERPKVHVVTYELAGIEPAPERTLVGNVLRLVRGSQLRQGDSRDGAGPITRRYPWQSATDKPSPLTCYLTQAWWYRDDLNDAQSISQFPTGKATYEQMPDGTPIDHFDLGHDFLPIVTETNEVTDPIEHFGPSVLADALQAFDDLAATDSDVQKATSTTGSPPIGLAGVDMDTAQQLKMAPGELWGLGPDGRMFTVDTAAQLQALQGASSRMRDIISENTRVSASLMGRVKPSEVPSGLALQLGLSPTNSLVRELRIARKGRYRLLFRMVQRIAQVHKARPDGVTVDADLVMGAYLPTDVESLVRQLVQLLPTHGVSTETAVRMLQQAGYEIDDIADEVAKIDSRDVVLAEGIVAATGDEEKAAKQLGATAQPKPAEPTQPVVPPTIVLPGQTPPEPGKQDEQTGSAA